ncbi:hypothetical protein W97_08144 [Coniosporium apollinis CBS 100218]|uniref:Uncharacterized protein n=1 Tax=Coniosporium apollinis (strain CBS 100218) TaxID=1168221 RepID=R7Z4L4_CONA1|nr:uncharacterized protein W97_08144 [Coniosporium apollinis CBS 100218]EON68886.1 hypothetical protein W97_08144 [Coniosporium apollinis CBS 100218]
MSPKLAASTNSLNLPHSATASECSTPLTPTFSLRGHSRFPSSTSSLSSSPPLFEHPDVGASATKLPQLTEEPVDQEAEAVMLHPEPLSPCLCDVEVCARHGPADQRSTVVLSSSPEYDFSDGFFGAENDLSSQHMAKKRRSGLSPSNSIATRFGNRFPSLSKRWSERKRSSTMITQGTRSPTPSFAPSSRSSSITGSLAPAIDQLDGQWSPSRTSSSERQEDQLPSSPIEMVGKVEEPIDRDALASTPLLPPVMVDLRAAQEEPVQSPLQSPTIAGSCSATPTPQIPGMSTPALSAKPSMASFNGHTVASAEFSPIMIADPDDKWSHQLGHANFTIYPEPYLPENCNAESCHKLFADWEAARFNYTKHQVRTGEHYGETSKAFQLTEKKWDEVDAQWKRNHDLAVAKAAEMGQRPSVPASVEPAPIIKTPALHDPKSEGKFPKLGDEDIVGPMVQLASQIQPRPSKKAAFIRFFSDIRQPGALLGRSALGLRAPKRR